MRVLSIVMLLVLFVLIGHVPAQDRSVSVLADWMASSRLRNDLDISETQEKEILALINQLRVRYKEFFDAIKLPAGKHVGPRAEIIADTLEEFQKLRRDLLEQFESQLMEVLNPTQGDQLLGRLIQASGPRSMLESSELRKRLKLTKEQIVKLEQIYIAPQDEWQAEMHRGDKFQYLDNPEDMLEYQYEYSVLRHKIVAERIWKVRDAIDQAEEEMDELAMRTITPEQKLIYDHLESVAPKSKPLKQSDE